MDEGQHKEMPKDPDSQLLGWRWISLNSCGFQCSEKLEVLTPLLEIHGNSTQHVMLPGIHDAAFSCATTALGLQA